MGVNDDDHHGILEEDALRYLKPDDPGRMSV